MTRDNAFAQWLPLARTTTLHQSSTAQSNYDLKRAVQLTRKLCAICRKLHHLFGSFAVANERQLLAEIGLPVLLQKLTIVQLVRHSGLELAGDFLGNGPAAKRALLGPFSGDAGFTSSSAIPRRRQPRVLLSIPSKLCDSHLWFRSLHRYSDFCRP